MMNVWNSIKLCQISYKNWQFQIVGICKNAELGGREEKTTGGRKATRWIWGELHVLNLLEFCVICHE